MTDHQSISLILLICVGLLVAGLRMMLVQSREVGEISVMVKVTLDAASKLLRNTP